MNLRMRELRKERGWTLQHLSDKTGMSIPHLSDLERGKKQVTTGSLEKIAEALDVPAYLLIADSDVAAFVAEVSSLSEADQERVRAFVQALQISED